MSPVNVLYVIDKLAVAGAQRHLVELATRLDRSLFEPQVCCLQHEGALAHDLKRSGIRVFALGVRRIYVPRGLVSVLRLACVIRKQRIRILHSYLFTSHLACGLAAALRRPELVISARRDVFSHVRLRYRLPTQIADLFVDHIAANSRAVAATVARWERFPPERTSVIYNGVDLARFNPSFEASEFRRSRSIPEHVPLIGTVANLNPVKGVDVFVRCAAMLSGRAPEARFIVAGAGPLEEELARLRNELGLDGRLIFAGSLEDVRPLLASLDVFMLLSRSEGMSNALLEAMAMAKPIVATRVGGNAEAIGEGETGFLVPSENPEAAANAALRLIRDGRLAGRLGLAARRRAELSFSLQRMVERTQNLYTGLLARSRRRGHECLAASARRDSCGAAMFQRTGDETGK